MKKFLIVSALSILFPYSLNAEKKLDANHVAIGVIAVAVIAGAGSVYYYKTRYNTPSNNSSLVPTSSPQQSGQQKEQKPTLGEQLNNPQPLKSEDNKTEDNNSQKESVLEKPQTNHNTIISPMLTPEDKSSSHDSNPVILEKQQSFSEALYQRFRQPETEKLLEKLLTDHAFSD